MDDQSNRERIEELLKAILNDESERGSNLPISTSVAIAIVTTVRSMEGNTWINLRDEIEGVAIGMSSGLTQLSGIQTMDRASEIQIITDGARRLDSANYNQLIKKITEVAEGSGLVSLRTLRLLVGRLLGGPAELIEQLGLTGTKLEMLRGNIELRGAMIVGEDQQVDEIIALLDDLLSVWKDIEPLAASITNAQARAEALRRFNN
jgi:hypothetical protein